MARYLAPLLLLSLSIIAPMHIPISIALLDAFGLASVPLPSPSLHYLYLTYSLSCPTPTHYDEIYEIYTIFEASLSLFLFLSLLFSLSLYLSFFSSLVLSGLRGDLNPSDTKARPPFAGNLKIYENLIIIRLK